MKRRLLLATGIGAILGFQGWKLAEYGFAVSIPWYGQAWIWIGHVFLGFAIGATAGWTCWWKRAFVFGLAFSIASTCGAIALGPRWVAHSVAATTESLVAAPLIAFLVDLIFPRKPESPDRHSLEFVLLPETGGMAVEQCSLETRRRLAEEKALLDELDREREYREEPTFRKRTEDRIIWCELLDLELQDCDEQLHRIRQTASDTSGPRRRRSNGSPGRSSD